MSRRLVTSSLLSLMVFLVGCTTPPPPPAKPVEVSVPQGDKAILVFSRPKVVTASLLRTDILVDGIKVGTLSNNSSFFVEVAPGRHEIKAKQESLVHAQDLENAEGGKRYYYEVRFRSTNYFFSVTVYMQLALAEVK